MKTFDLLWTDLTSQLKPGQAVNNWTAYRGYLGDKMTIVRVGDLFIEVDAPKVKTIQHVPKDDFRKVWNIWADYKTHKFARSEMTEITWFSKYIISILHWADENIANE